MEVLYIAYHYQGQLEKNRVRCTSPTIYETQNRNYLEGCVYRFIAMPTQDRTSCTTVC
jgi:hypothetical protein